MFDVKIAVNGKTKFSEKQFLIKKFSEYFAPKMGKKDEFTRMCIFFILLGNYFYARSTGS